LMWWAAVLHAKRPPVRPRYAPPPTPSRTAPGAPVLPGLSGGSGRRDGTAHTARGFSSVGRALAWHARGQRFDSAKLHHRRPRGTPAGPSSFPDLPAGAAGQITQPIRHGALPQQEERMHGMQEVSGSTPLSSTIEGLAERPRGLRPFQTFRRERSIT